LSFDNQRRQRGKEDRYSDLLIDPDGDTSKKIDMVVAREQRDQRKQDSANDSDPALQVESKQHRSQPDRPTIDNTPVPMPLLGPGRQKPVSVCHWHTPDLVSEGPKKGPNW
jgi:hypothetical protein